MATIDGYDLRERPWQPGLDDARFNQQPRNPNFAGGASPEAAAYQRANDLRGMAATERPWTGADTKAFGNRPAGVPPSVGEPAPAAPSATQPASRLARTSEGAGRLAGRTTRFGLQALATAPLVGFGDYRLNDPGTDSSLGGTLRALGGGDFTGAGRSLQKGAVEAVLDAASGVAKTVDGVTGLTPWGTDLRGALDRRVRADLGDQLLPADGAGTQPAPGGPGVSPTPSAAPSLAYQPNPTDQRPAAGTQRSPLNGPVSSPSSPSQPAVASGREVVPGVYNHGRGQYSDNPNGMGMPEGFTGRPSAQNDAILQRMSDQSQAESMARVGMSQYNAEVQRAQAINADERARHNSPAARMQRLADPFTAEGRALRNLRMDIGSSLDRKGRPTGETQALMDQYKAATGAYLGEPGQERVAATERYKADQSLRGDMFRSEAAAGASRYAADQSLRGDIFKSTAGAAAQRAAAGKDAEKYAAERRDKATERLDKVFSSYATVDGKVDEGRLAALRNGAQAFLGTAIGEARKRGDNATVTALEKQGLAALADDPSLMQKYAAALKLDSEARRSGGSYVGTDNPGARTIESVTPRNFLGLGGDVRLSDGTRVPRNRVEYDPRSGILPNPLAHIDPWSNRTTEYDVLDPQGALRKATQ